MVKGPVTFGALGQFGDQYLSLGTWNQQPFSYWTTLPLKWLKDVILRWLLRPLKSKPLIRRFSCRTSTGTSPEPAHFGRKGIVKSLLIAVKCNNYESPQGSWLLKKKEFHIGRHICQYQCISHNSHRPMSTSEISQMSRFIRPTVKNIKTFHLQSQMTNKSSESLNSRSWNQQASVIFCLKNKWKH